MIPPLHIVNVYAYSGATNTYFRSRDVKNHKTKTTNPVNVQHAGGNYMISSHITTLDLPMLSNKNIIGHVLPQLKSASLLSIGQLYDTDCTAYFNKKHVYMSKNKTIILQGSRDNTNVMWKIPIPIKTVPSTLPPLLQNNISLQHQNNATLSTITPLQKIHIPPPNNIPLPKSYVAFHVHHVQLIKDQISYLYAALFSPAISTFLAAINLSYFATFSNLTTKLVQKHLTKPYYQC